MRLLLGQAGAIRKATPPPFMPTNTLNFWTLSEIRGMVSLRTLSMLAWMATVIVKIPPLTLRSGAMTAQNDKRHRFLVFGFLFLVLSDIFVLNYPNLLIERLPVWYSIVEPALLIIGLFGCTLNIRLLRFLGWTGIFCFLLALLAATPDLDHADPELRGAPTLWRVALTLTLLMSLIVCFRKLENSRSTHVSKPTS
jgi:hypothetical protein